MEQVLQPNDLASLFLVGATLVVARLERADGFGTGLVGAGLVPARPECIDELGKDGATGFPRGPS